MASDGRRLHYAPAKNLGKGYYNSVLDKINYDHAYPDVERLLKTKEEVKKYSELKITNLDQSQLVDLESAGKTIAKIKIPNCENNFYVNFTYLKQALSYGPPKKYVIDNSKFILFFEDGRIAIVTEFKCETN